MLYTGTSFVKKKSCLVARIVSFDTVGNIPVQRYSHISDIIIVPFKSYLNQCF